MGVAGRGPFRGRLDGPVLFGHAAPGLSAKRQLFLTEQGYTYEIVDSEKYFPGKR